MEEQEYKYRGICHTKCFWLETLWDIGDEYSGNFPPNKHFSADGTNPNPPPPDSPGSDIRSNIDLKKQLKKLGFDAPKDWTRKQLWTELREREIATEQDALTANVETMRQPAKKSKE